MNAAFLRLLGFTGAAILSCAAAEAQTAAEEPLPPSAPSTERSLDDAWWTGPMLANSAATLPKGRVLVETYFYDVQSARGHALGSTTYLLYGVTDTLTMGLKPSFGYNLVKGGPNSSRIGIGDLTVQGQYRLTRFDAERGMPALGLMLQQSIPTGRYDQLGERLADGLGGGSYGTTLALNAQYYFWLPNGRILRGRVNVSGTIFGRAKLRDESVYGTKAGFRGRAVPAGSTYLGSSLEYSATKRVALALDVAWTHQGRIRLMGEGGPDPVTGARTLLNFQIPGRDVIAVAPGIEYSWTPNLGVLLAARLVPKARNVVPSIAPAIAINAVF